MAKDSTVMFVLGGPGSGKGTQCAKTVEKYGWKHFSAGDLLRAEVKSGSEQGHLIQDIMNEGAIVPFEITIGLISEAMKRSDVKRFLIDGFPRALDQASAFEESVCPSSAMLFLNCPEHVMEARLLGRSEGRADDNPETVKKRFRVYQEQTMPVVEKYERDGKLRRVPADRSPDAVFADVSAIIEELQGAPRGESETAAGAEEGANLIDVGAEPQSAPAGGMVEASEATIENTTTETTDAPHSSSPLAKDAAPHQSPIVIMGPSGVGKGTLVKRLMAEHGDKFAFTVSHTTRKPREGEEDGVAYVFVDKPIMQAAVNAGSFLEHAEVHGNLYGTSIEAVQRCASEGKSAVLEIDVQGARLVKSSPLGAKTLFVFIKPPSMEALEARLRGRGSEDDDTVQQRLENAAAELAAAEDAGLVHHVIVNDEVEAAYRELCATVGEHLGVTIEAGAAAADAAAGEGEGSAAGTSEEALHAGGAAAGSAGAGASGSGAAQQPRDYLNDTVVEPLREAMLALNEQRPSDPLQFLIEKLTELKAAQGGAPSAAPEASLL